MIYLLTYTQAERFINKLGAERYNERISVIEKYKEQWELSEITFQQSLSINSLIFYAYSKQYGKVILKILINNDFDEDVKEIMSLIQFQGENFCKLYEYSLEDKVYIMERIIPADTLYESARRDERIKIVGAIFKVLHKPDLPDRIFPTYSEWFDAGKTYSWQQYKLPDGFGMQTLGPIYELLASGAVDVDGFEAMMKDAIAGIAK